MTLARSESRATRATNSSRGRPNTRIVPSALSFAPDDAHGHFAHAGEAYSTCSSTDSSLWSQQLPEVLEVSSCPLNIANVRVALRLN
jgi:hypothetical protein